ncbi:MAG: beta-glucosidase [Acidobacteriota bacterium]|nr:beta-glucosidase [Acidobacteriota bacterium]MDQ3490038.1 beta-glucosidase [Acidobacteriota bacterium]
MQNGLFPSFFMGGFECSTHRNNRGKRLDLVASTRHDEFAELDYSRLIEIGIRTARDGVRWHLIEIEPFRYDFSSLENQVAAARKTGIRVIWDYFHYGFPNDLDIFTPEFIERFVKFAAVTTEYLQSELGNELFVCPVNEISFFSWIAGDVGNFYPNKKKRGNDLKRQLVRTAIQSTDVIKFVCPTARILFTDPAIHVVPKDDSHYAIRAAENYRSAQFDAFDMLAGIKEPELGGNPKYLDLLGLNYYFHNQWRHPSRRKIPLGHKSYRPFHSILNEFAERYGRPIVIAETGIEDEKRPEWFRYVCEQTYIAISGGTKIEGMCLYPIVNHPGWADNRHCNNGLWDYANDAGQREIYQPLADEIQLLTDLF